MWQSVVHRFFLVSSALTSARIYITATYGIETLRPGPADMNFVVRGAGLGGGAGVCVSSFCQLQLLSVVTTGAVCR